MSGNVTRPFNQLKTLGLCLGVFALLVVCYWPALNGTLVWDDLAHVTRPDLRSVDGLVRIWTDVHSTQQYYPVLHSAFWIEHRLWGDTTLGYHLTNIFQHAIACGLLALLLHRLWHRDNKAISIPLGTEWLAAFLFAAHPVCVESVAWISEQKNTLSLVLYLLAALVYLDFDARRRVRSYVIALGLFLLALGAKSTTSTLPAALLVIFWWKRGRLSLRSDIVPLVPWFVLALGAGLFTAWVELKLMGAEGAAYALSLDQRLLLAGRVIWFYLGKLLWPAKLMFIYPRWDVQVAASGWYGYLGATVAVTVVLWFIRRRFRGPLAIWLLYIGTLFPALGFFNVFPFIYSFVADHFQYLASLSMAAGAAAGIGLLLARASDSLRKAGWMAFGVVIVLLGVFTAHQSRSYRDSETLYRDTLEHNPECWMAHNNLAAELVKSPGHEEEAYEHFNRALRIKPDHAEAHSNLAAFLAKIPGREMEALAHYEAALRFKARFAEAHNNLAILLGRLPNRGAEALAHFQEALSIRPDDAELHFNLAGQLATISGRETEAIAQYLTAIRYRPDYAMAYNNMAVVYAKQGRTEEAARAWEKALQIDPSDDAARINIGLMRGAGARQK